MVRPASEILFTSALLFLYITVRHYPYFTSASLCASSRAWHASAAPAMSTGRPVSAAIWPYPQELPPRSKHGISDWLASHEDIQPQPLLLDPTSTALKLPGILKWTVAPPGFPINTHHQDAVRRCCAIPSCCAANQANLSLHILSCCWTHAIDSIMAMLVLVKVRHPSYANVVIPGELSRIFPVDHM